MSITMTFTEDDFERLYLALWSHRREMWKDYTDINKGLYESNKILIELFKLHAKREGVSLP